MKNKKGFTLVELLAVVAILSLLVIIALPNIVSMFNEAKENSFLTECKQIYKTAQQEWMKDSMFETNDQVYTRCKTCTGKTLSLSGRKEIDFYVKVNKAGNIVKFYVTDGTYQYVHDGDLLITDITTAKEIASLPEDDIIKITTGGMSSGKTVKLVTSMGSFSETENLNEIYVNIVNDGYTYTTLDTYNNTTNEVYDNAQITLYYINKFKTTTYIKVYSDSSKTNLLAEINYNDFPQNRYSINTGRKIGTDTIYSITKKLVNVNIDNLYYEMSDDVCMESNCPNTKLQASVQYYSGEYERTISGPWVTDVDAISKIMVLNRTIFSTGYDLIGFEKCNSSDCEKNEYHAKIIPGVR